ncbi:MAG: hypothetical protein U1E69_09225 [Tabrizicola sp.]|uniref:hypothetical protein n=1 Tax=Tabrizicola sp. TaxID=2005166 RepID=UPI002AB8023C|nr:hypothetical protein [Tabrizicola sp.]MDZ4086971.1 hypothetical protein [Tabrizicola sp.]
MSGVRNDQRVALPIKVGLLLTFLLLLFISYLAAIDRCVLLASGAMECRRNVEWFLDSSPNEIGDTIAGIFATLAFVWIVVTVFLQSAELAEQRDELSLTREELRLAREAQEKQLEVMEVQARIFEDEKRQRHENRAKEQLDLVLPWLAPRLAEYSNYATLTFKDGESSARARPVFSYGNWIPKNCGADDLMNICSEFERFARRLPLEFSDTSAEERAVFHSLSAQIKLDIAAATKLRDQLSEAEKFRLRNTGLDIAMEAILAVEGRIDAWESASP